MEKYPEQDLTNKSLSFFLKMKAFFPKSKKIYFLIYILKLIPLIVITHDWNITSKYSISFWIRKFTLAEIISTIKRIELYYIIGNIFFIFSILSFIFFFFSNHKLIMKVKFVDIMKYIFQYIVIYYFISFIFFLNIFIQFIWKLF